MSIIILTADQLTNFNSASGLIMLVDGDGRPIGYARPIGDELGLQDYPDLAELERRRAPDQPRYTTQQVLQHLESLEKR